MMYLLFEGASGYGLFDVVETDEIGLKLEAVQKTVTDLAKFGKVIKLKAFQPFTSAQNALENINDVSEGIVHDTLTAFLENNLPKSKPGKKPKYTLGVYDAKIGASILESLSIPCTCNELTSELLRGVRLHFDKFIKSLRAGDAEKAQLGLGHSYSRAKVKFNVNRVDNMIIQAIALLDQLDKDVNTFAMRVREWYSWHFPELVRIVNDNYLFAKLVVFIRSKSTLTEDSVGALEEILMDSAKAQQVVDAAKASMGQEISDIDLINIEAFAKRVVSLSEYRKNLHTYLVTKMSNVAPNLSALIGEQVGARLISHAGSLTNLAKYPASTVQILGAEKALFRALKTKGNTPKYGLIFHSSFIGKAGSKNKGRISRYLANKCSIASRIDCFTDLPTEKFGAVLRGQVEERLRFYETGETPRKNLDVMQGVLKDLDASTADIDNDGEAKKMKKKKRKSGVIDVDETPVETPKKKKSKKKVDDDDNAMDIDVPAPSSEKKKKKKRKSEGGSDK